MSAESLGLGRVITTPQQRDATHVAVVPMTLPCAMSPGEHVLIANGVPFVVPPGQGHGIIDPFLVHGAQAGDTVWIWMYPGSITSLRHDFTHPALDNQSTPPPTPPLPKPAARPKKQTRRPKVPLAAPTRPEHISEADAKEAMEQVRRERVGPSEDWIKGYADDLGVSYDELMEGARGFVAGGGYMCRGAEFEGVYTADEFWDHYEVATGTTVAPDRKRSFFSCAC